MIKVIAIGNSLMCDDGIAIKVIDYIERDIEKLNLGIKLIKAETDINYAIDNIDNEDFIIIIDSTLLNLDCGKVTEISLGTVDKYLHDPFSIHGISLLSLMKRLNIKVDGCIIGIEVIDVSFSLGISKQLDEAFYKICSEVYEIIKEKSLKYVKRVKV